MSERIRIVTIKMDLAIPSEDCECISLEQICDYLNQKLYSDPEFFGEFREENVEKVGTVED